MSLCFDGCFFFFPRLLSCSVHFDVGSVKLLRRHDHVIGHFEHITCVTKRPLSVTLLVPGVTGGRFICWPVLTFGVDVVPLVAMFLLLICFLCEKLLAWLLSFQMHRFPSFQFYLHFCKLAQNISGDKTAVDNSYTRVYANTFTKRKEPFRLLQTARVVGRFSVP